MYLAIRRNRQSFVLISIIRYAEEKLSWQREIRVAENEVHESEKRYSEICCQLSTSREHIEQLRNELDNVSKRLARGIEENECLYR